MHASALLLTAPQLDSAMEHWDLHCGIGASHTLETRGARLVGTVGPARAKIGLLF